MDNADEYVSPYIYVGNLPISVTDPDGNFGGVESRALGKMVRELPPDRRDAFLEGERQFNIQYGLPIAGTLTLGMFAPIAVPAIQSAYLSGCVYTYVYGGAAFGAIGRGIGWILGGGYSREGFLFNARITISYWKDIAVQRFGTTLPGNVQPWGLRLGNYMSVGRGWNAIKTWWNPLTRYTIGKIPAGEKFQLGITAPQYDEVAGKFLHVFGIQFNIDNSKVIIEKTVENAIK